MNLISTRISPSSSWRFENGQVKADNLAPAGSFDSDPSSKQKAATLQLISAKGARLQISGDAARHSRSLTTSDTPHLRPKRQTTPAIDPRSEQNIQTLNSQVRATFRNLLQKLNAHLNPKGVTAKFISGNRSFTEQDALYAKGRPLVCRQKQLPTARCAGATVTNARGGYSNHNFGLAVDVGLFSNGRYLTDSPHYDDIGRIVAAFPNLEWGGNWSRFKDKPHVQWLTGLSMIEMRERIQRGETIV